MERAERPAHVHLLRDVLRVIQAERDYRPLAQRVCSVERRYLREVDDDGERRAMRIGTAKMLFYAAVDKGATFRTVQRRFSEVLSLPSGYLPAEVAVYTEFAAYCDREGRPAVAIGLLEGLQADLKRWEGRVAKGVLAYCRGQVTQTLGRLRTV